MPALDLEKFAAEGSIRFANASDIPEIMQFIHDYWSEKHILANDREIFEFQYVYGDEVCFVLDTDKEDKSINALLGYIPYGLGEERDIFTAIWKVKKRSGFMQGMELILFLEKYGRCRNLYCVGLADKVVSMIRYMRKQVRDYEHYFLPNPGFLKEKEAIGNISDQMRLLSENTFEQKDAEVSIRKLSGFAEYQELEDILEAEKRRSPSKTEEYIKRRYFEHPEYSYDCWYVRCGAGSSVIVARSQQVSGTENRVYRVVDVLGDLKGIPAMGVLCRRIFAEAKDKEGFEYEYADCLVCGLSAEVFDGTGFVKKAASEAEDDSIVPNYFEPFEKRNIIIHNFFPKGMDVVMFKGDGDQDRPSIRKNAVNKN